MFRKGSLWCSLLSAICSALLLFCIDPLVFNRHPFYLFFIFFMIFFMNFVVIFQYFYNIIHKINDPSFNKYSIGVSISGLVMFTALYKFVNNLINNAKHLAICFFIAFMAFLLFSNLAMKREKKQD